MKYAFRLRNIAFQQVCWRLMNKMDLFYVSKQMDIDVGFQWNLHQIYMQTQERAIQMLWTDIRQIAFRNIQSWVMVIWIQWL